MRILKEQELASIKGGGAGVAIGIVIGTIIVFLAGLLDGISRPISCEK